MTTQNSEYRKNLTDLMLRYEQGEFIRTRHEGSPIQRLLRELTLRVQELEDELKKLKEKP